MEKSRTENENVTYNAETVRVNILKITGASSQKDLAEILDRTESNISKKMNGYAPWQVSDLMKLSERYNVSIDRILGIEKNVKERPLDNEDPTIMACRLVHELCSLSGYRCDVKMDDDCPQVVGTPVIVQKIIFGPNWKDNDYACHVDLNLMNRFLVSYNATSWAGLLTDTDAKKDYIELLLNQVEKILQDTDSNQ